MNNHVARFEHFKTTFGDIIFDRKTHTLLDDSCRFLSTNKKPKTNDKILFSLYPHRILAHIKVPACLFAFFIIISLIMFIVATAFLDKWICYFSRENLWLLFLIEPLILLISVLLHELSHAIIAINYGGFVAEIGVIKDKYYFRYYTRIFWDNTSIRKKLTFLLGGIAMNIFLSVIGCFILYRWQLSCGFFIYITNSIMAVMNLIPQKGINSDGYQIVNVLRTRNALTTGGKQI